MKFQKTQECSEQATEEQDDERRAPVEQREQVQAGTLGFWSFNGLAFWFMFNERVLKK